MQGIRLAVPRFVTDLGRGSRSGREAEIVEENGGAVGYCVLPDGTRVDKWENFGEDNPDES